MAGRKDGRGRPRGARFTHTIGISFNDAQWQALDALAERANVSVAAVVRDCVDAALPSIKQRIRRAEKKRSG